jgi:hypothetical protein
MIQSSAAKAKMNLSEYIVALSQDKPIIVIDDVPKLVVEIIRIGTNINQIAKRANSQKYIKQEEIEKLDGGMKEIQRQLSEIIKKINKG